MTYTIGVEGVDQGHQDVELTGEVDEALQRENLWNYTWRNPEGALGDDVVPITVQRQESDRDFRVFVGGDAIDVRLSDQSDLRGDTLLGATSGGRSRSTSLRAPMPGLLKEVLVKEGAMVLKGEPLCILEAMKMENELKAPGSFRVSSIGVEAGGPVEKGTILMRLDPIDG